MTTKTRMVLVFSVFALSACGGSGSGQRPVSAPSSVTTVAAGTPAAAGCAAAGKAATPVLGIHHVPSLTRERYEAVVRKLTNGRDRLQSVSDGNIDGLLVHVAGEGDDGFWVVDVWASQEAADRFGQSVRPIAQAVGIQQPMKTYPIHTLLTC